MRSPFSAALVAALLFPWHLAEGAEFFVAPNGNDAWTGALAAPNEARTDGPFATLTKARDAVRAARKASPAEPVNVQVRGGLYELGAGLKFSAEDSGTAAAPVVWRAFENEKPILAGGRAVKDWKPWKGAILQADVGAQGFRGIAFKQLFFGGERQHLARYPNYDPSEPIDGGWAYVEGEMWPMYADREGEDKHTLQVASHDWRKWERPEDVEVFIFPRYNWWNNILPVKAVDAEKRVITTAKDASYAMRANDRYFVQGALEELDAPGEWYLDRRTWTLYFHPPAAIDSAPVIAPTAREIIRADGVEYLTFRGFTLESADGGAVVISKAKQCRVIACTVRNVGDFGASAISLQGEGNGVIGCDISQTGSNGIALGGGDTKTLTAAGNFAENCYVHHVGVFYKQGAGVVLGGVGQRVSHCLIHDTPRFGLMFSGNNHVIEYNHLRHLALETEDVGATYSGGRDWLSPRGSVIRYNFIHDILGYGWNGKWTSPYFAWGIYLDDNSGGVDVIGNIVARCGRSLIHGHSARDCRVENNIFIEGGLRQWEFNGWTTQHRFWSQHLTTMMKGWESVKDEPAWKKMRGMDVPPDQLPDGEGRVMSGNVFTRNIIAWQNDEAKALNVVAFSAARNSFDRNLYWHHGKPLLTGVRSAGPPIGDNLIPNAGFDGATATTLPEQWLWQIRPAQAKAGVIEEDGKRVLRIDAAFDETKKRDNSPIVASRDIELKPGAQYLLRTRLRTDRAEPGSAGLKLQFYLPAKNGQPGHFWASSPNVAKVGREWQQFEFTFVIPKSGDKGWHPEMKKFRARLDWPEKDGALFASDVALFETEPRDEWQSWNELGGDRNSVIADPKFLAPEKDDYRLAPDSPAWALGFQPIPVEKIGPQPSADRATWPIVEAAGARERLQRAAK